MTGLNEGNHPEFTPLDNSKASDRIPIKDAESVYSMVVLEGGKRVSNVQLDLNPKANYTYLEVAVLTPVVEPKAEIYFPEVGGSDVSKARNPYDIDKIAAVAARQLKSGELVGINITGHTDYQGEEPKDGKKFDNKKLSSDRANNVTQRFIEGIPEELRHLVHVTEDAVGANDLKKQTHGNEEQNRRVTILGVNNSLAIQENNYLQFFVDKDDIKLLNKNNLAYTVTLNTDAELGRKIVKENNQALAPSEGTVILQAQDLLEAEKPLRIVSNPKETKDLRISIMGADPSQISYAKDDNGKDVHVMFTENGKTREVAIVTYNQTGLNKFMDYDKIEIAASKEELNPATHQMGIRHTKVVQSEEQQVFARVDKNHDGKWSRDEVAEESKRVIVREKISQADENKDGKLDNPEVQGMDYKLSSRMLGTFKEIDPKLSNQVYNADIQPSRGDFTAAVAAAGEKYAGNPVMSTAAIKQQLEQDAVFRKMVEGLGDSKFTGEGISLEAIKEKAEITTTQPGAPSTSGPVIKR